VQRKIVQSRRLRSLMRGEVEPEVVNENLTKSGKVILCQWHNSVLRNPQGEIVGAMSLGLDITEARRAELELKASRRGLRSLARHLHTVREEERGTIARVIHDELGQTLTGMKMDLYWLKRQLNEDQGALVEKIETTLRQIDEAMIRCYRDFYMPKMAAFRKFPDAFRRDYMLASMKLIMKSSFIVEKLGRLGMPAAMAKILAATRKDASAD